MWHNLCRTKFHSEEVLHQTVSAFELFLSIPRVLASYSELCRGIVFLLTESLHQNTNQTVSDHARMNYNIPIPYEAIY